MKEPVWIRQDVVLRMHEEALMLHGGPEGVRDLGLLESALARPKNLFAYSEQDLSIARFAASYAKGILANHPFVDGNKRTAFTVSLTLQKNRPNAWRVEGRKRSCGTGLLTEMEWRISLVDSSVL
jgi:death-on-curing protein